MPSPEPLDQKISSENVISTCLLTRRGLLRNASTIPYTTVPKIWQISEKIREEVPWRELYPVIH
jgi:hypothetical protein